ncbi:hypothetical protein HDV00_007867 [Rhizophlyctis rosea]|nr:hypothetical protein HDV00_007867 [Rhizophlyctis rosea]
MPISKIIDITAEVMTIQSLLLHAGWTFFFIPSYQRPYSWGKAQVTQLLRDIRNAYDDEKTKEKPYYLGSIVLYTEDSPNGYTAYVVDGQQRLSTFMMFMVVARHCLKNWRKPPFHLSSALSNGQMKLIDKVENHFSNCTKHQQTTYAEIFTDEDNVPEMPILQTESYTDQTSTLYDRLLDEDVIEGICHGTGAALYVNQNTQSGGRMNDCVKEIYAFLEEAYVRGETRKSAHVLELAKLCQWICSNCCIAVVKAKDYDQSLLMFSAMNSGIPLTDADRIKALVARAQYQDASHREKSSFLDVWQQRDEQLFRCAERLFKKGDSTFLNLAFCLVKETYQYSVIVEESVQVDHATMSVYDWMQEVIQPDQNAASFRVFRGWLNSAFDVLIELLNMATEVGRDKPSYDNALNSLKLLHCLHRKQDWEGSRALRLALLARRIFNTEKFALGHEVWHGFLAALEEYIGFESLMSLTRQDIEPSEDPAHDEDDQSKENNDDGMGRRSITRSAMGQGASQAQSEQRDITRFESLMELLGPDCSGKAVALSTFDKFRTAVRHMQKSGKSAIGDALRYSPLYNHNDRRLCSIGKYVLLKLDLALRETGSPIPKPIKSTIEHILPQKLNDGWPHWETKKHYASLHLLGNLTLLTTRMNSAFSNLPYDGKLKKVDALGASMFELTKRLVNKYRGPFFIPEDFQRRHDWMCARFMNLLDADEPVPENDDPPATTFNISPPAAPAVPGDSPTHVPHTTDASMQTSSNAAEPTEQSSFEIDSPSNNVAKHPFITPPRKDNLENRAIDIDSGSDGEDLMNHLSWTPKGKGRQKGIEIPMNNPVAGGVEVPPIVVDTPMDHIDLDSDDNVNDGGVGPSDRPTKRRKVSKEKEGKRLNSEEPSVGTPADDVAPVSDNHHHRTTTYIYQCQGENCPNRQKGVVVSRQQYRQWVPWDLDSDVRTAIEEVGRLTRAGGGESWLSTSGGLTSIVIDVELVPAKKPKDTAAKRAATAIKKCLESRGLPICFTKCGGPASA